jgi:hypothetical protein
MGNYPLANQVQGLVQMGQRRVFQAFS